MAVVRSRVKGRKLSAMPALVKLAHLSYQSTDLKFYVLNINILLSMCDSKS